jgi:hypothetical protein
MGALKHMLSRDEGTIAQVGSALSDKAIRLQGTYREAKSRDPRFSRMHCAANSNTIAVEYVSSGAGACRQNLQFDLGTQSSALSRAAGAAAPHTRGNRPRDRQDICKGTTRTMDWSFRAQGDCWNNGFGGMGDDVLPPEGCSGAGTDGGRTICSNRSAEIMGPEDASAIEPSPQLSASIDGSTHRQLRLGVIWGAPLSGAVFPNRGLRVRRAPATGPTSASRCRALGPNNSRAEAPGWR